ncbi:hypothetical protein Tco_1353522 [Tanacetum coccineum]
MNYFDADGFLAASIDRNLTCKHREEGWFGCVRPLLIAAIIVGNGGESSDGSQGWACLHRGKWLSQKGLGWEHSNVRKDSLATSVRNVRRRVLDECSTCTLDFNIQHHLPSLEATCCLLGITLSVVGTRNNDIGSIS